MDAKRFTAADMRRALQMVREHLGPDAVILSSKKLSSPGQGDYVEIIASDDYSVEEIEAEHCAGVSAVAKNIYEKMAAEEEELAGRTLPDTAPQAFDEFYPQDRVALTAAPSAETTEQASLNDLKKALLNDPDFFQQLSSDNHHSSDSKSDMEDEMDELRYELEGLRRIVQSKNDAVDIHLAGTEKKDSVGESSLLENLRHRLELMGVPSSHHEQLLKPLSHHTNVKPAWRELLSAIQSRIKLAGRDWVDAGGVFALVGPTGVGKTTTMAKLATRYALQYGAEQVGLISLDSQRVGGAQQLQTVGKLLGVPVRVVGDSNKLDVALRTFRNRSLVLIDTPGVCPGDESMSKLLSWIEQDSRIKTLLTLSVTSQYPVLKSWLHAYRSVAKGLLITKLDEAVSVGEILAAAMDSDLPLVYTTDGQLIPESIALPNLPELMALAVDKIRNLHQMERQTNDTQALC